MRWRDTKKNGKDEKLTFTQKKGELEGFLLRERMMIETTESELEASCVLESEVEDLECHSRRFSGRWSHGEKTWKASSICKQPQFLDLPAATLIGHACSVIFRRGGRWSIEFCWLNTGSEQTPMLVSRVVQNSGMPPLVLTAT